MRAGCSLPASRADAGAREGSKFDRAEEEFESFSAVVLAVLLQRRKLITVSGLPWGELAKATLVSIVAGVLSYKVAQLVMVDKSRAADLKALALITITWGGATAAGLWITKSQLPGDLRRRGKKQPPPIDAAASELSAGIEP